jgi:hypothetical protein
LKNIYKSLANDGVLVISEWLLNDEKTGPASAALMGLNMIIETYGGKNYSNAEIVGKLNQAGFKRSERRSSGTSRILYHWSQIISKKDTRKKIGAFYKGITIMTSNEIDARQMDEDDLEEADRIMKLVFGTFIGLPTPVINVKSHRKREKIVRPQSCIPFPVHTTASIDR